MVCEIQFIDGILKNISYTKFHENPSSGEQSCFMRTNRHDESSSRFSQFRERA